MYVNQKEKIPGYNKRMWFRRRDITNIISLKNLSEQYRVTYYINKHMLIVYREVTDLQNMEFLMHDSGLHYYEPTNKDLVFLNTVSKNKEGFSRIKTKSAVKSQELQHILVFLTIKEVKWIIRSNHIQDCLVETEDVENYGLIWGKYMPYIKWKTTRKNPIQVTEDIIRVPKKSLKPNKGVFLNMDIFFVNKIPFLITLRHKIDFTATSKFTTQTDRDIFKSFWSIYVFYLRRGFKIMTVHADGKFTLVQELITEMLSGLMVHLMSANMHAPEIERRIRVFKERCRATRHSLLFMRFPVILTINMVINNVNILGYLPTMDGISTTIITRAIMTGETLNYKRHLAIHFGQYCQIHEEEPPRNRTRPLTRDDICMGTSGKNQGRFNFMTLGYMKKVARQS